MAANLRPNVELVKTLMDQWEREDQLNQPNAYTSFFASPKNQLLLLLFAVCFVINLSAFLIRRRCVNKRATRRQLYMQNGRSLEAGKVKCSGVWDPDMKYPDEEVEEV